MWGSGTCVLPKNQEPVDNEEMRKNLIQEILQVENTFKITI